MIEKIVLEHLKKELRVPVSMEVPHGQKEYVVIEKVGGGKEEHISSAMMAIQSYGDSLLRASAINELVKKAMESLTDHGDVCRVELNSDYNYTDTEKKKYRYQAVFDIFHY